VEPPTDLFNLEILDTRRRLLTRFPVPHAADQLRVFGDRLFLSDTY